MSFSIISSNQGNSLFAEIALMEGDPDCAEMEMSPEQLMDAELKEQSPQGFLRGEAKSYTFLWQEGTILSQKLTDYLSQTYQPKEHKKFDLKSKDPTSSKNNVIKQKVFTTLENSKSYKESTQKQTPPSRLHHCAKSTLEKAILPKSIHQLKETPLLKQQQNQAKKLEQKVQNELNRKDHSRLPSAENRRLHPAHKPSATEKEAIPAQMTKYEKNDEREQQHKKRQQEEGFAEGDKQQHSDHNTADSENQNCLEKVNAAFAKEVSSYAIENSILSEIFNMRVSQFDVLILFIEILKIEIRSREQEKLSRREERELQLVHMQNIVENYKSQGKWLMFSSIGSGVLAIASGVCPIVGHVGGTWILQKLGSVFSKFRDMDKDKFFKSINKITFAMSEMYKSTGQIYQTFSEGHRTYDQHMSDLHRMNWEENTRSIEEIKDSWKGIENFLYQALQMYHESIRQLYSH